ncbi:MAG: thiamine pyrophosphate-dependent dehydrogenase E1 component subunit alpha [Acidobacteriaceae bacterium]|nr:thiamine pyrophosphate-dependent dehydrogenase E1 component subunit alpha [Acidobacteriaceae bacterium]
MQTALSEEIDVELSLDLYRCMLQLRDFELKVQELYRTGSMPGFVHLYVGEEAVAAGVCASLKREDLVYSTHRGHGHALAKGVPARELMAELWGKRTGCCGGRGGSMHTFAPEYGFMGTNGIVGGSIPLAAGSALAAQLRNSGQVVVSFFGDGAVNAGSFHESLNLAAVWNLPVVFACENNLYATEMAFYRATKNTSVASRAAAYAIPGQEVDGVDVHEVYGAAKKAIQRARTGGGPTLLEFKTYRTLGHHEGDPGTEYRTREEVAQWKARCPIKSLRERMIGSGQANESQFEQIQKDTDAWLDDAVQFAKSSPTPDPQTVLEHS